MTRTTLHPVCLNPETMNPEIITKEFILNNLFVEVSNKSYWIHKMDEIPYTYVYGTDLAVIFRVRVNNGSYILSNAIIKYAGIDRNELLVNPDEWIIKTLSETMAGLSGRPVEDFETGESIYVLTNRNGFYGSNVMLRTEILDKVADSFGGEMWIIPSSVHEVLAVRKGIMSYEEASKMIQDINSSVVDPREVMSDHPYQYIKGFGFI